MPTVRERRKCSCSLALVSLCLLLVSLSLRLQTVSGQDDDNASDNQPPPPSADALVVRSDGSPSTTAGPQCSGQWRFPAACKGQTCQYVVQWNYNTVKDLVDFVLSTNRPDKWVGVGFSRDKRMANTDVVVAWVEPGGRYVMMDAWVDDGYAQPVPDAKQSIQNISAAANNGLISFLFSRAINTGDESQDIAFDECFYLVYPVGGGQVDIGRRNIKKHGQTPQLSEEKICLSSCIRRNASANASENVKKEEEAKPKEKPDSVRKNQAPEPKAAIEPSKESSAGPPGDVGGGGGSQQQPTPKPKNPASEGQPGLDQINNDKESPNQANALPDVTKQPNQAAASVTTSASITRRPTTATNPSSVRPEAQPDLPQDANSFCKGEWRFPNKCQGYGCDYKATWEYLDDADDITFTVSTKNRNKWTGIGFSANKSMPGTDAVLGLVEESGRFFLMDTWLRGYQAPPLDPIQNIHNMSIWRENGVTSLKFNRKRRTGDKNDFQFSDSHCPYFVFPVQGGVFNAVNKRLRKHEVTPLVSERRICVKSCRPAKPPVSAAPPVTAVTQPSSTAAPTTSPSSVTQKQPSGSTEFDYSQLGLPPGTNLADLNGRFPNGPPKLPPGLLPANGQMPDLANITSFLENMNMSSSDIPTLLRTLAGRFPGGVHQQHNQNGNNNQIGGGSRNESAAIRPNSSSGVGGQPVQPPKHHSDLNSPPGRPTTTTAATSGAAGSEQQATPKPIHFPTSRVRGSTNRPERRRPTTTKATTSTTSTTTSTTPAPPSTSTPATTTTTTIGSNSADEVGPTTTERVEEVPAIETNYAVELKLPKAWKPAFGRKGSDEYKKFKDTVEVEVRRELEEKLALTTALEVRVTDLLVTSGSISSEDKSNKLGGGTTTAAKSSKADLGVLAKLKLVVREEAPAGGDANSIPSINVTEALNLAIQDGRLGDVAVDASYLVVRPFVAEVQQPTDKEAKFAVLTDEQLKWLVIVGGVAALVILVVIQASCMVWRDKRNHARHLSKVALASGGHPLGGKGSMLQEKSGQANGGWKDYPPPTASSAYSYENFAAEEPDSGHKTNKSRRSNGGHSGKHNNYGEKGPNGYGHGPGDTLPPLPSPPLRGGGNYETRQTRDGHRGGGSGVGHMMQPLQPDFYFMPHQRRYSGEVVRVFVDNPQYNVPK